MRGGNVVQLDADDDAMWGIDGHGNILWRPAGDVGKHSRWMRVEGPPEVPPSPCGRIVGPCREGRQTVVYGRGMSRETWVSLANRWVSLV